MSDKAKEAKEFLVQLKDILQQVQVSRGGAGVAGRGDMCSGGSTHPAPQPQALQMRPSFHRYPTGPPMTSDRGRDLAGAQGTR